MVARRCEKELDLFSMWMNDNSGLADSSIYKYSRAINTISNEMLERKVISKKLIEMNLVELDFAISSILLNDYFCNKNTTGNSMYSNALKQFRCFRYENKEEHDAELHIEKEISQSNSLSMTEKQMILKQEWGRANID